MPRVGLLRSANTAGAAAIVMLVAVLAPLGLVTITGCGPAATSTGTCALICPGDTYRIGAFFAPIVTFTPSNVVGRFVSFQPLMSFDIFAMFVPKMLMSST